MTNEYEIIRRFQANVYGRKADTTQGNQRHDGRAGHWLEAQMGISHNADNSADLLGYEMKNQTSSGKTTFGDWSADYYLFKDPNFTLTRTQFIEMFGKPNPEKENRYSWSGSPIPTIHRPSPWNGSRIVVDDNDTIVIVYDYSNDPRANKSQIIPSYLQIDGLVLASWSRDWLEPKLTKKFAQNGWFKCYCDEHGVYNRIAFGEPMNFDHWLNLVRQGVVFFDSGMYVGNSRNYSQWRANNTYWESLIVREYPPFP